MHRIEEVEEALSCGLPAGINEGVELLSGDSPLDSNFTKEKFCEIVNKAKEHIFCGDIFQVVLSQRMEGRTKAHPFQIYRALRMLNPSPYMFF